MVPLAALSLSVDIVEVIDKALIIVERKEEYKQSYKFYKQLLNLYKAPEISEEEVYKREEYFVNNLVINEGAPERIQTDKGLEFVGQTTQKHYKENNIQWFTTENVEIKAAMVKRFNLTLGNKIKPYLSENNTEKYIDVWDKLIKNYNTHSSPSTTA
ncbi:uncharacterized transposon-derived protein F54H12.3 [Trichonephila clavipes]|nr:uncharacterized transposon-derived protein F54H12.3 [Trichonephila clavipes]